MRFAVFALFAFALAAQPPDSQIVFEVATVKPGPPGDFGAAVRGGPGTTDPMRYSVENYPLSSLVELAYGIGRYQLVAPSWLDDERFTITANLPPGATKDQVMLMMRNLLVERFKLAAHRETKEIAGYQLAVAKRGPKLAVSPENPKPDAPGAWKFAADKDGYPVLPAGRQNAMAIYKDLARWRFADTSMDEFARKLGEQIRQPVVNATGLADRYDFVVSWSYAGMRSDPAPDAGPTIFVAVEEQLGLKLEAKKVPVDAVVVDRIEKSPSEN